MFLFETAISEGIPGTARLLPYEPQVPWGRKFPMDQWGIIPKGAKVAELDYLV